MFIRCPTCGTLLANKYKKFAEEMEKKYGKKPNGGWENMSDVDNSDIIVKLRLEKDRYCCSLKLLCNVHKESVSEE